MGPEGPETPVNGGSGRKTLLASEANKFAWKVGGKHLKISTGSLAGSRLPLFVECLRCANTQPFLCNELGPFQAILGNFQASLGNLFGPFQVISGNFQAISGNLGNFGGAKAQEKNQF